MKILLVNDNHKMLGGAEKHFFRLKFILDKHGFDVYSLGFSDRETKDNKSFTLVAPYSRISRHFSRLVPNFYVLQKLRKIIKSVNPDIIHLHNSNIHTIPLLMSIKGYPAVNTVHDFGVVCPIKWGVHKDLSVCKTGFRLSCFWHHNIGYDKFTYMSLVSFMYVRNTLLKKVISKFITPSPILEEYMRKNGFRNVETVPNFVERLEYDEKYEINKTMFSYIGRLSIEKGIDRFLYNIKYLVDIHPNLKFNIVGKGPLLNKIKRITAKNNLSKNVNIMGWVDDIHEIFNKSLFLVVPSIWMENAPLVIQESFLHKRTVAGSNRGGIPWLLGKEGFVFDPLNTESVVDVIDFMLSHPKKIINLGKRGYHRIIRDFSVKKYLEKIIKVYEEVSK